MSTLESEKLITEKFLENAINEGNTESFRDEVKNESEKLILDEISNEKIGETDENQPGDIKEESLPESYPLTSNEIKDVLENITEETESSSDLKTAESSSDLKAAENSSDLKAAESQEKIEELNIEKEKEELEEALGDKTESEPKNEWQDVLGSGVIMKKILNEGEPDTRPHRSDRCFINFTCRLEDADEQAFADKGQNYELALGEGDVVQGLDVAIGLMNKKERCLLKIGSRLAFGEKGLVPNIPGNATVVFDVELVEVQSEEDFESMSVQERRRVGNKKRERGNWWYHRGENTMAVQCYRRALDFLDEVENENNEEKPSDSELQQLLEDRLKVLNNMASAQIKMELYAQAQISLQSVLKCQPNNVKALFRKAKISVVRNELAEALKLLEKAKSLEPDDPLIAKEIGVVNGLRNKQKSSEREYARRMFGSSGPAGSSSNTKVGGDSKKANGRGHLWVTLGVTIIVGIAGIFAYKFK